MSFLFLLVLTLACLPDNWQSLTWGPLAANGTLSTALTWTAMLTMVAVAVRMAQRTRSDLRLRPAAAEAILDRYRRWRHYHLLLLIGVYAVSLTLFGWAWTMQSIGPADPSGLAQMVPGAEVLLLAPFFAALVTSWACFYDADRAFHDSGAVGSPFWTRGAYIGFHIRQNLGLVAAPVGLLILQKALKRLFAAYQNEWTFLFGVVGLLVCAFIGLPWVLRFVLRLRPLPEGDLRRRLLKAGQRHRFACSNIMEWNTHGAVANAMVVGIVPWIRYVILTDRLIADLTPDELEAVFGHEMGHIKHRHMIYYLGFLLISLAVVAGLYELGSKYLPLQGSSALISEDVAAIPLVGLVGAYIFVVFGFLSRRCERQADLYGCRTVSCAGAECGGHDAGTECFAGGKGICPTGIQTFINALEKVARLNGISRSRPGWLHSWQHWTIARRVDFLESVRSQPLEERRFQRRVGLVKVAVLAGLCAALVLLAKLHEWDWSRMFGLF
jgi:Zn-dependent protease with chaperone function